jgi:predicted short-subunit dehydrogenase-like oxidoreductase (DUF2520 family)
MKTLSFIGCGAVGQTLGRLFHQRQVFRIQEILTRSPETALGAAGFIGAGHPVHRITDLQPADILILAVSDDAIAGCAAELAASGTVAQGTIACHLSGALSSEVLAPLARCGALTASVHPVKSFADSAAAAADFEGTWCGMEGDAAALATLEEGFRAIGGTTFGVDPRFKTIYHAGSVLVCNYLTALVEAGVRAYQKGGLPRDTALQVLEPLARGTLDNIFRTGTALALTGPIARGDAATVGRQLDALEDWDAGIAEIYRVLGRMALQLAGERGTASQNGLERIAQLLK